MTQQDTIGSVKAREHTGIHVTNAIGELFFKTSNLGNESSLGPTKEHTMFVLAQELFGRGVAESRVLTIHRQLTIDTSEGLSGRPDAEQLRETRTHTLVDRPQNVSAVRNNQKLFSRHLQVSVKVQGRLLNEVVTDTTTSDSDIAADSLSEAIFLSLISMADDAKRGNFIVNEKQGVIGIDNDHVFGFPYTINSKNDEMLVNFKNFFLANQAIVDTEVHQKVLQIIHKMAG